MSKTKADKLIEIVDLTEARRKRKIAVDENLIGLGSLLRRKGYNVLDTPKQASDEGVHGFLLENNVKIFITKNGQHFIEFFKKREAAYSMLWIQLRWDDESLVNAVNRVIMNDARLREPQKVIKHSTDPKDYFQYVEMDQHYADRFLKKLGR